MKINSDLIIGNSNVTLERLIPHILFESANGDYMPILMNDYKNNYYCIDIIGKITRVINESYISDDILTTRVYINKDAYSQTTEISGNLNVSGLNTFVCWGVRAVLEQNIIAERTGFDTAGVVFSYYYMNQPVWLSKGETTLNYKVLKVIGYK